MSPIFTAKFVSISLIRLHIRLHWYEPLCTDMSRSPEAYLHTPTAYQTDLSCGDHDAGTHTTGGVTIWKLGRTVGVFYGTEKREGERLEIYTGGISPCSRDCVSDL
jgi:hypothetical protein